MITALGELSVVNGDLDEFHRRGYGQWRWRYCYKITAISCRGNIFNRHALVKNACAAEMARRKHIIISKALNFDQAPCVRAGSIVPGEAVRSRRLRKC